MKKGGTRTAKTYRKNGEKFRLTPVQKVFAETVAKEEVAVLTGKKKKPKSGTAIALETYDTDKYQTAAAIASENLQKPEIMAYKDAYVEKHVSDARIKAQEYAPKAVDNIINIAETAEGEKTRLDANDKLVKIAGVKQETDTKATFNIESAVLQFGPQREKENNEINRTDNSV